MLVGMLSSSQYAQWIAYFGLEPFGYRVEWTKTALLAATIANSHRGKGRVFAVEDFMPDFSADEIKEPQTFDQLREAVFAFRDSAKKKGLMKRPKRKGK